MAKSTTPRVGVTRWSAGTDTVSRIDFDTTMANIEARSLIFYQGTLASRPAAGLAGRQHVVVDSGDSANNGRITYDTGTSWVPQEFLTNGIVDTAANNLVPLTVRGASGQTTDYFRVEPTSGASPLLRVNSSGVTTNQDTVGVGGSAGAYLGRTSGHDASLALVSVAAAKPVLVVTGAASQSAVLASFRASGGAQVGSITAGGNATFSGTVAANILQAETLNVTSVSSGAGSSFINPTFNTADAGQVPVIVKTLVNQTANALEIRDSNNANINRFPAGGGYATNQRVSVGAGAAGSTALSGPVLVVSNTLASNVPAARFLGNSAQAGGNVIEVTTSASAVRWGADIAGNTVQSGTATAPKVLVGAGAITTPFAGTAPVMEVQTGSAVGTYDETFVIRHAPNDATAVSRKLTLQFKQSSEASSGESAKWAGIGSQTGAASASAPALVFYTAGTEAGRFDASNNLSVNNSVSVGGDVTLTGTRKLIMGNGHNPKVNLLGGESYSLGTQSNTVYVRTPNNFNVYKGGSWAASGGTPLFTVNGDSDADIRMGVDHLTLKSEPADSFTPALKIAFPGTPVTHMALTSSSIVSYLDDAHSAYSPININTGDYPGGIVNIGNAVGDGGVSLRGNVSIANRFYITGRGLFIQASAPGGPSVMENDIWINTTGAGRVNIRKSGAWVAIGA